MNWLEQVTRLNRENLSRVNLFGAIIYTDANPHTKKVLHDNDYWIALDEHSGSDWAVFAVRCTQGAYGTPRTNSGYASLIPIWQEPCSNREVLDQFEIESSEKLPCLVVYTQADTGETLKLFWKIDERTELEAYHSLSEGLKTIREAMTHILPEYRQSAQGVFRAAEMAVESKMFIKNVKKGFNILKWIKDLLP